MEERASVERYYRACDFSELLKLAIFEVRRDSGFAQYKGSGPFELERDTLIAAIRKAVYEAMDYESDEELKGQHNG